MGVPSRIRVVHVITRLIVGGAQENTIASVKGLQANPDWLAELIAGPTHGPEGSLEHLLDDCPEHFTRLEHLVRPVHPWRDLLAFRELTRILRERAPTIVHTHSGKAGVLGRMAAKKANVPIIVHTIHGPSFGPFQGKLANFFFRRAERMAGAITTHFITVAHAMTRLYLNAGIGRPEQYTRIFSGFDLAPYANATNDQHLRTSLGIEPNDFVVGKIARLFQLKGHDDLFTVIPSLVAKCPRMKFLLIGDGPWRERFEQWAKKQGFRDHVIFVGLVPPERVSHYTGIMDTLVHLSRREGLPRALPQALATGKPVVGYDTDGASEVCHHGQTGFLINVGDLSALQESLLTLEANPNRRQEMGERGKAWVGQVFSVDRMIAELSRLYHSLLASHFRSANQVCSN